MQQSSKAYVESQDTPDTTIVYVFIHEGEQRLVSAALFNNVRRQLQVTKFYDNEHYVSLQSLLIHLNPSESASVFKVYIRSPSILSEKKKINEKFVADMQVKFEDAKVPLSGSIQRPLQFLLKGDFKLYSNILTDKQSMMALEYLLKILDLQQQPTNESQLELKYFENSQFMKLDKSCLNALNIFSKDNQRKIVAGNSNIFDILNKCKTTFGTRHLKRWMKQPIQDKVQLERRNSLVQYYIDNSQVKTIFQNQLKKLPDLEKIYFIFYKVQSEKKVKCQITDLMKMYNVIETVKDMLDAIERKGLNDKVIEKIYTEISDSYLIISKIKMMIQKFVDMQGNRQSQFLIKAEAEPSLTAVSRSLKDLKDDIQNQRKNCQKQLKEQVTIIESQTYKFVFETLKRETVQKVKKYQGYKFISAKQTKITFTTERMIKFCNQFMALESEYKQLQQTVLKKIFKIVAGYYPVLEKLSAILAEVDILTSWATIINTSTENWCKPVFCGGSQQSQNLRITQMRHPCVKNCVSNDLNSSAKKNKTIILTGPNMGGKSTFIRTAGVCCYLAHIGMFVPAQQMETPIIDAIICRVGASDQQVKGISTFMSEMMETSCMMKTATKNSLVLIDQLGRGTSTNQGFGISWSICKYLHLQINPFCLFATHFHEMVKISDQVEGISNMYTQTEIVDGKLLFRYKVLNGKMEKSYGIQVAEMLGFPQEIIQNAYQYLELFQGNKDKLADSMSPQTSKKISKLLDNMEKEIRSKSRVSQKQIVDEGTITKIQEKYYDQIQDILRKQVK